MSATPRPGPGPDDAKIVGRLAELATARRLVDDVRGGAGRALVVTGEAGIGKSRLLAEVARLAGSAGLVLLTGRAAPTCGTYRPLAEALAGPLRRVVPADSARLRPFRPVLDRLLPGWSGFGDDADARDGPTADPVIVPGEGVLALLQELAGDAGCLLLLEDLHWADADTLRLVAYLADVVEDTPALLALSARDDTPSLATTTFAGLRARPSVTALRLEAPRDRGRR